MRKAAIPAGSGSSFSVALPAGGHDQRARGDDERLARVFQRPAERLDRGPVAPHHVVEVGEVAAVGHVQDAVGGFGAAAQAVEVVQGAAVWCGAQRLQPGGGGIRARQTGDGVAGRDELGDDGGAGLAGTTGDKDMHETLSA